MTGTGTFSFGVTPKVNQPTPSAASQPLFGYTPMTPPSNTVSPKQPTTNSFASATESASKGQATPASCTSDTQTTFTFGRRPTSTISPVASYPFPTFGQSPPSSGADFSSGPRPASSAPFTGFSFCTPRSDSPMSQSPVDVSQKVSYSVPPDVFVPRSRTMPALPLSRHPVGFGQPTPGPAATAIGEAALTKGLSAAATASINATPVSPQIKLEEKALPEAAINDVILPSGPVDGNVAPSGPEVSSQMSGAKRKAEKKDDRLFSDGKRAKRGFWHESKYANLTIFCNARTWRGDCAMLFWRCPALEFNCESSSSVAGQYELKLDDEDPGALGVFLGYLREDTLPKFATLHDASLALRIGLKYEVPEYKAHATTETLSTFSTVELEELRVEEFVMSLPTWWEMDQDQVAGIKSAALKLVAKRASLLLQKDYFQSLLKSNGAFVLDAMGALAAAKVSTPIAAALQGENPVITEAQAQTLFRSNGAIRRLLAAELEKSVKNKEETLRKEFQGAQVEIKRQLTSAKDKAACAQARIEMIQGFASANPNLPVGVVWSTAKLAKAAPAKPGT